MSPPELPRSCFVGVTWNFFHLLEGTNSKIACVALGVGACANVGPESECQKPRRSWEEWELRSRREWVPARTSVQKASAKNCAGREKNGEESSWISLASSPKKVSHAHPPPPATQANSKTEHHLVIFLWLNTLNATAKASAVDLLRLNTLRCTKTAFWTPKTYDKYLRPLYMGVTLEALLLKSINYCVR